MALKSRTVVYYKHLMQTKVVDCRAQSPQVFRVTKSGRAFSTAQTRSPQALWDRSDLTSANRFESVMHLQILHTGMASTGLYCIAIHHASEGYANQALEQAARLFLVRHLASSGLSQQLAYVSSLSGKCVCICRGLALSATSSCCRNLHRLIKRT